MLINKNKNLYFYYLIIQNNIYNINIKNWLQNIINIKNWLQNLNIK